MQDDIRARLWELRQLRRKETEYRTNAAEYLYRATKGMSFQRATDRGGTGSCPLTDYAERHSKAISAADCCAMEAESILVEVKSRLDLLDNAQRKVIVLYYDQGLDWDTIAERTGWCIKALKWVYRAGMNAMG